MVFEIYLYSLLDTLTIIADTALIASGAQYVACIIPICIALLYILQKFYLRTSRQLRFLDLETKAPLYTNFTETLRGLITIRAFGWGPSLQTQNFKYLASSQQPYYLLYCIQRWLNLVLDLAVAGIAIVVVSFAINFHSTTSSAAIGLAMLNILGFNQSLSMLINSWTTLETSLGAIARLRDFARDTPSEISGDVSNLPESWPSVEVIEFNDVSVCY